ncbi:PLP-dependent aminotransferase family protein [Acidovorax sp.]|uniref:aminotransferase-like domain-containing protein n=1 Tax=Acidovorax sp. TaxID=1872122 RepID=UPI0025C35963|nr:PLP-dependent aminotransferase family protein [Acidovorax sp.]
MKRYEQLAGDIAESIANGTLPPGARLPSVRQTSDSRGVSPSTVFQAYYLLEGRGLIQARPRSGYYVAAATATVPEPESSRPSGEQQDVEVSELVFQLLEHMRDRDLVPLGSAFPDPSLFPLDRLAMAQSKAMRHLDPWRTVEHLSPGNPELRRQITLRYLATAFAIDANELVITNGAMEALNLSLEVVTKPGDLVAVESPTFYGALQALERLNLRAIEVPTHPRTGVDVSALAAILERHPVKACWFMPNFQNPLGSLMPDEAKQALVRLLSKRQIPLIEDDVYGDLYFGTHKPRPAKAWDTEGLVLHCSSFSKTLAPGYRIGWVAAGRFSATLARRKLMSSLTAAIPSQEALSRYLQQGSYDRHLRRLRLTLQGNRAVALRSIGQHFPAGTRASPPEGGYFLWIELPTRIDALALHRLALAHHVSSAPGHLFSADHRFRHHLRINFGQADSAQLDAALKQLGKLANSLAQRGSAP